MEIRETYQLTSQMLAIYSHEGNRTPVIIPSGATVVVTNSPLDGVRMVDVLWEEKTVMAFTEDLRERGMLVKSRPATNPSSKKKPRVQD